MEHEDKPAAIAVPVHTMEQRLARVEHVLFGDPTDTHSPAVLPVLARVNAWLDAACWGWRAIVAAATLFASAWGIGKGWGWW